MWLGALGLFVATFVSGLASLVLWLDGWPVFAATFTVVVLANRAIAASGLRGKDVFGFYKNKPRWMFVVQLVLLALIPVLGLSIPDGRANGDVCAHTVEGKRIELSLAACQTLRVRTVRCFAEISMALGWFGVVQFALARNGERLGATHQARRSM